MEISGRLIHWPPLGARKSGRFLETLARPHVIDSDLQTAYEEMAADEVRESEAEEWVEGMVGDVADEPR